MYSEDGRTERPRPKLPQRPDPDKKFLDDVRTLAKRYRVAQNVNLDGLNKLEAKFLVNEILFNSGKDRAYEQRNGRLVIKLGTRA